MLCFFSSGYCENQHILLNHVIIVETEIQREVDRLLKSDSRVESSLYFGGIILIYVGGHALAGNGEKLSLSAMYMTICVVYADRHSRQVGQVALQ